MILSIAAPSRSVYACDSFSGLPAPTEADGLDSIGWQGQYQGATDKLREGFRLYADPQNLSVVEGWFEQTIPDLAKHLGAIAVLHVDADWYESVDLVLEELGPKVSPGGFIVVDDYTSWIGAQSATNKYRESHAVRAPFIDRHYWRC